VNLFILEMTPEEAEKLLNTIASVALEMKLYGFPDEGIQSVYSQAQLAFDSKDYLTLKTLSETSQSILYNALKTNRTLSQLSVKQEEARENGLITPQTDRLTALAIAAFDRGDFDLAKSRVEEALLTFALETKGEFNFINFVQKNWPQLLLFSFLMVVAGIGTFFRIKLSFINKELKNISREEQIILGLVKETQMECFDKKKMSIDEYHTAIEQYDKKLNKCIQRRIELEAIKSNLLQLNRIKALRAERKTLLDLMKETQSKYLEKGTIETRIYETRMKSLKERLSIVEEKLTTLEAQKAIKKAKRGRLLRKRKYSKPK
jgi:hypothetical protein